MGIRTAAASAILPGLGQLVSGKRRSFKIIWTGLILSVVLFPLPGIGTTSFLGIYAANIYDAYHKDRDYDLIDIENWDRETFEDMKSELEKRF